MKPGGGWRPDCQSSPKLPPCSVVAARLPLQEPVPDRSADAGLISIGNQVATHEGR